MPRKRENRPQRFLQQLDSQPQLGSQQSEAQPQLGSQQFEAQPQLGSQQFEAQPQLGSQQLEAQGEQQFLRNSPASAPLVLRARKARANKAGRQMRLAMRRTP